MMNPEMLLSLKRLDDVALSPCGSWMCVAVTRRHEGKRDRWATELWRVSTAGGETVQLTRGGFSDRAPQFRSDGAVLFLSNRPLTGSEPADGEERRSQIWLLPSSGEPRPLTDEPLGVLGFVVAARAPVLAALAPVLLGTELAEQRAIVDEREKKGPSALLYTDMPVRYWDAWRSPEAPHVVLFDGDGGARRDLTPSADAQHRDLSASGALALSDDGSKLALVRLRATAWRERDAGLYLVDLESGAEVTVDETDYASAGSPSFSPDGRTLAFRLHAGSSDRCGEVRLELFDVVTKSRRALASSWDRWPGGPTWSADSRALWFTADDGGDVPVFRLDLEGGAAAEPERQSSLAVGGSHDKLCALPDGSGVVGLRSTLLHPPEAFVLRRGEGPRLLSSLSGLSPEEGAAIAEPSSFVVIGDGGVPVKSHLLLPKERSGALPTLLWVHGGPITQFSDGWHWRWNALTFAAQGYAVALPNPRGSTGFGQELVEGIWSNQWGDACYRDVLAVADGLAARDDVDGARMAVMGGSFGGYMTNWIAGQTADRFRCFITHASVFHMSAFQSSTDFPSYWSRMMKAAPFSEGFERYSPHTVLDGWRQPALVIHGEKDYRVSINEALALYEGLRARGVPAELLVFPDENHWIAKPRNIVAWNTECLRFLASHLGASPRDGR